MTNAEKVNAIIKAARKFRKDESSDSENYLAASHILKMAGDGEFDQDAGRAQRALVDLQDACRHLERAILDEIFRPKGDE